MQILALVWGLLALLGFMVAFIPCLGSLNWLNIPFAVVGLAISIIAYMKAPPDKKGTAIAGIVLCAIAIVIGYWRLTMGGGVL